MTTREDLDKLINSRTLKTFKVAHVLKSSDYWSLDLNVRAGTLSELCEAMISRAQSLSADDILPRASEEAWSSILGGTLLNTDMIKWISPHHPFLGIVVVEPHA